MGKGDQVITEISKTIDIEASHLLPLHEGQCRFRHGHSYTVTAWAQGTPDRRTGILIDFADMKAALLAVVGRHDHGVRDSPDGEPETRLTLDQFYDGMPTTAENLAYVWLEELRTIDPRYVRLRVAETRNSYAEVTVVSA